ncbi:MAG: hypothetical protein WC464_06430 [Bdellovibrionales bacterium]
MRFTFFTLLFLILGFTAVSAQPAEESPSVTVNEGESQMETLVSEDLPTITEPYTITNVNADVTADTAAHARDKALMQAQREAYKRLCARFKAPNNSDKLSDDDIAALVQSFEVQRERVSAVRYIGVYTIRFNPSAVQGVVSAPELPSVEEAPQPQTPVSHIAVSVQTDSLMIWMQYKRRLMAIPQVSKLDVLNLGRGLIRVDLSYVGLLEDLKQAAMERGLVLRQNERGVFELFDSSTVSR